jgi:hypothetical protein
MANSISVSKTTQEGTSLDTLVKEGKALYNIWKQTNSLKDSTKAKGFDTRLGKLLVELKAQSSLDSGQISRQTLATYHVDKIDRRRRSEALWFVENEVECREFIEASKKGFTSLTALQAAMRKAAKADDAAAEPTTAKAEPSNVGQSNGVKDTGWVDVDKGTFSLGNTRTAIVDAIFAHCNDHQIDIDTIIADLQSKAALANKVAA